MGKEVGKGGEWWVVDALLSGWVGRTQNNDDRCFPISFSAREEEATLDQKRKENERGSNDLAETAERERSSQALNQQQHNKRPW